MNASRVVWLSFKLREEPWNVLKKIELLSATPRATRTHLSCSPNFTRASYLDERTLTYEPIVNLHLTSDLIFIYKVFFHLHLQTNHWSFLPRNVITQKAFCVPQVFRLIEIRDMWQWLSQFFFCQKSMVISSAKVVYWLIQCLYKIIELIDRVNSISQ